MSTVLESPGPSAQAMSSPTPTTGLLSPLGGPVVVRLPAPRRPGQFRLIAPQDTSCFAAYADWTLDEPTAIPAAALRADDRDHSAVHFDLQDAARRVGPRTLDAATIERGIAGLRAVLRRIQADHPASEIVVPAADRVDVPSLRLLAAAWSRDGSLSGTLVLETVGPGFGDADADAAQAAAFDGLTRALHADGQATAAPRSAAPRPSAPSDPRPAFLRRNYGHALAHVGDGDQRLLLRALVAARLGRTATAVHYLDALERSATTAVGRAAACSTRSVVLAKCGDRGALRAAADSVSRGLAHVDGDPSVDARCNRGWLHNHDGLIHVMDYLSSRDRAALDRAAGSLRAAMAEVAALPADQHAVLHLNVQANAVQLLDLCGRPADALRWLDAAFAPLAHPVYAYRRAALLLKVGRPAEALEGFDRATAGCDPLDWPYRETIERGRAAAHLALGDTAAAAAAYGRGLRLCFDARAAAGATAHAAGRMACLRLQGQRWLKHDLAEVCNLEGIAIDPDRAVPPRPPAKLPTHVAELDLQFDHRPAINARMDHLRHGPP
jgi:hypothetical protein